MSFIFNCPFCKATTLFTTQEEFELLRAEHFKCFAAYIQQNIKTCKYCGNSYDLKTKGLKAWFKLRHEPACFTEYMMPEEDRLVESHIEPVIEYSLEDYEEKHEPFTDQDLADDPNSILSLLTQGYVENEVEDHSWYQSAPDTPNYAPDTPIYDEDE